MIGAPSDIVDESGAPLRLGTVLGQGGEGAVWDIPAMPSMVAKVYHQPLSPDRTEKIRAMSRIGTGSLVKLTAWPERVLFRKAGPAVGLLIPKVVDGKDIHKLYSPKSRRTEFGRADWRFLVHAAGNTARAFAAVHDEGHVIGDVNHGSVLVSQDATVRLVDCDSFQITAGGRRFLCEKGVETFTPPELQGKPLSGIIRKPNHDNFGLAVLVFQLLFLGRHPFAGRYSGVGDMPISTAIKEIRFPYGTRAHSVQMSRPPGTPPLSMAGRDVELLFERAFAKETTETGRPTARDWISSLEALEKSAKQCGTQKSHWFPPHLKSCPWCEMEHATGATLFPFVFTPAVVGSGVDVASLFRRIESLSLPPEAPSVANGYVTASAAATSEAVPEPPKMPPQFDNRPLLAAAGIAFVALLVALPSQAKLLSFILPLIAYYVVADMMRKKREEKKDKLLAPFRASVSNYAEIVERYGAVVRTAKSLFDQGVAEWKQKSELPDLQNRKEKIKRFKGELDRLPNKRRMDLDALEGKRRLNQMSRHLERYRIIDASIDGIGRERKLTLESYGIENADDVTSANLAGVPGFGPKLTNTLLSWRRSAERSFVFDPSKGVDPSAIASVEQAILAERSRLERQIELHANYLLRDFQTVSDARTKLRPQISSSSKTYAQSKADFEFVSSTLRGLREVEASL